jgi:glycosyltransferase involved in cell wall biosynthesis
MNKPKVAFVTSHPIQYQVPVFRALAQRDDIDFRVFFAMLPDAHAQGRGFGVAFEWDIPLLEGYDYTVLKNVSRSPSVVSYRGCDTPDVGQTLAEWGTSVTIVNGWVVKSCIQTLRWCRRNRIPCFVRGEANHLRPRPWWKKVLQKRLVRQFSGVLPIGRANRAFYASYGVSPKQMFMAPYCVDNSRFGQAADLARNRREEIRKHWHISHDAVCFLFCAKFETKKHPLELVKAFLKTLETRDHHQHLLMVGDGALRPACEELVNQWYEHKKGDNPSERKASRITFAGFLNQSEIIDAYAAADCLVLPSDHGETWGLVVNEAFAAGIPAIVSDQVGCHLDLITPNETGLLFPFGDWEELARQLNWCVQHSAELRTMGANAQKRIQDYSPVTAADGIAAAAKWVNHGK